MLEATIDVPEPSPLTPVVRPGGGLVHEGPTVIGSTAPRRRRAGAVAAGCVVALAAWVRWRRGR